MERWVRVLSRGEIVIPKEVRKALGWVPGDMVALEVAGGQVVLSRVRLATVEEASPPPVDLTPEEATLLQAADGVPASIDSLCGRSGLRLPVVMTALFKLEAEGLLTYTPYGYVRTTPGPAVVVARKEEA